MIYIGYYPWHYEILNFKWFTFTWLTIDNQITNKIVVYTFLLSLVGSWWYGSDYNYLLVNSFAIILMASLTLSWGENTLKNLSAIWEVKEWPFTPQIVGQDNIY